ncbi:MAG: hypothetical protein PHX54_07760 [Lentimicrobiaceae bacterium]|jgi:hypothetical protein|nr:hypothetical protein [Lentimicrobiaceae bacterium]
MKTPFLFTIVLAIAISHYACQAIEIIEPDSPQIPHGAIWKKEIIRRDAPLPWFHTVAIWAQAATMVPGQSQNIKAVITIDYWQVIEVHNGDSTIVFTEDYDYISPKYFSINEAGLYCRYPKWFDPDCDDYHAKAFNMRAQNGFLQIDMSQTPDNIVHWWAPRLSYKQNAVYVIKCNLKIEGATAVQFGMDYWRNFYVGYNMFDPTCQQSNNCEAWITNWITDTDGLFVTVFVPVRD